MPQTSQEALLPIYVQLLSTVKISAVDAIEVKSIADRILRNLSSYRSVERKTGIPWWFIAGIHSLESDLDFTQHLANGDPIDNPTIHQPRGIPAGTWEECAIAALELKGWLAKDLDWANPLKCIWRAEQYNGWGYRQYHPQCLSPYLWGGTSHRTSGKYTSDGVWDESAVSAQIGVVPIWLALGQLSIVPEVSQVNISVSDISNLKPMLIPAIAARTIRQPLSFGWACLKRMQALGWDLEHHEHKERKGEYWIQWGIEDCTKLGVPLSNDFWKDEYNDRYCTGIWIPSKNSFRMTLNCAATVEPGVFYTTHPMNPNGAARLDNEIQFKAWQWGMHGSVRQYRAMVQAADLSYTRDLNQDGFRTGDKSYQTSGNYINLHHSWDSATIDRNGAGCQVVRFVEDHEYRNNQADEYPHPKDDYFAYGVLDGQKLAGFWKSFAN